MVSQREIERRHASDRRRFARGGRRPTDKAGHAPLVLVADDDADSSAHCEAILAALRFAVAPAHSVDETLRVMRLLRPNVVVSHLKDNPRLLEEMRRDPYGADCPLILLEDGDLDADGFVDEIRRVLRSRATLQFPSAAPAIADPYRSGSH
jgi:CheY-like chemotaxis protein